MGRAAPVAILWLAVALVLAGQAHCTNAPGRSAAQQTQAASKAGQPGVTAKSSRSKAVSQKTASRKTARRSSRPKTNALRARSQQAPTPERYAEIQRALIERGYLTGPATGAWGPESVEALKRFQQDQNLEPTGKINALTLIALGLGPNRASKAASAQPGALNGQNPGEKPE